MMKNVEMALMLVLACIIITLCKGGSLQL